MDLGDRQDGPLGGALAGVADHAGAAADERDGAVPGALKVGQRHDADQVAGVQAGGRRVEALVHGDGALLESAPQRVLV